MNDVIVTLAISRPSGMFSEYVRRLSRCGIEVSIDPAEGQAFAIGDKLRSVRTAAKKFSQYGALVLSDGWDVMFYGGKEELLDRIPQGRVLCAAEKNCWPDAGVAALIPGGPWRFANGGLSAGSPAAFLEMCDRIESHPDYRPDFIDQGFMNLLIAQRSGFFDLDSETELFFCLYGGYDELEFRSGRPFNTMYGTSPLFVHANGHWPAAEAERKYRESLS